MSIVLLPSQLASIGKLLKEARELRGESLAQVATRIALTPAQLRAIEAGDLQPFYSPKYYDQAASRYAQALDVELPKPAVPEQLSLLTEVEADKSAVAQPAPEAQPSPKAPATPGPLNPAGATPVAAPMATIAIDPSPVATIAIDASPVATIAIDASLVATPIATPVATPVATTPSVPGQNSAAPAEVRAAAPPVSSQNVLPAPQTRVAAAVSSKTQPDAPAAQIISPKTWLIAAALALITLGVVKVGTNQAPQPQLSVASLTPPVASSVAADTPAAPQATTPVASKAVENERLDSHLETKASTWVQIVHADGSKTDLRVEPGERVEFNQRSTAAVAFGKPGQISLNIAGRAVDVQPYILQTSPARALVIMSQLKD